MYCVPECLSEGLVDLPESGMGYQLVRVESNGDARRFVILNAEWAIAAGTDWQLVEDADIRFLGNHDHTRGPRVRVYRLVDRMNAPAAIREAEPFPYTLGELKVERHGSFPAISGDDVFYRYSAFANDRRLRSEAGVIPAGTYLTSHRDTQFAESGLGAVRTAQSGASDLPFRDRRAHGDSAHVRHGLAQFRPVWWRRGVADGRGNRCCRRLRPGNPALVVTTHDCPPAATLDPTALRAARVGYGLSKRGRLSTRWFGVDRHRL